MSGLKHDRGKLDWSTLDMGILEPLVEATAYGAGEYGFMNYLKPFENAERRFFSAMQRHLKECQGEPLARDKKSGCYHLASVAFNALVLLYHARKVQAENEQMGQEAKSFDIGDLKSGALMYMQEVIDEIRAKNRIESGI